MEYSKRAFVLYVDLLITLILKNFKVRYKQSILGPLWLILQPLIFSCIFIVIEIFVGIKSDNLPYPVFVYTGIVPWTFFSNALIFSSISIIDNAQVIKKIACPREIFPVASVLTNLIDFFIAFLLLFPILLYFNMPLSINFLLLSGLLILLVAFTIGLSLFFSALAVYRRDVIIGLPLLMQLWLFASPVMYPLSSVPDKWKNIYLLNPMAGFIESYRNIVLMGGHRIELAVILSALLGTFASVCIGTAVFSFLKGRFADVV